jgi:hypothetical protein
MDAFIAYHDFGLFVMWTENGDGSDRDSILWGPTSPSAQPPPPA